MFCYYYFVYLQNTKCLIFNAKCTESQTKCTLTCQIRPLNAMSVDIKYCVCCRPPSELAELHQLQLLLCAGEEPQLPGAVHEDGGGHPAAGRRHHHPAAEHETGRGVEGTTGWGLGDGRVFMDQDQDPKIMTV